MRPDSLFVIGLGPTGGSVAWGAMEQGVSRVVGFDRVRSDAVQALKAGAVHQIADRLEDGVRDAQMVVITSGGADLLARITPRLGAEAFVTTVAQIAAPAAASARAAGLATRWAASHPLRLPVGDTFEDARPGAFRGAVVCVTSAGADGDDAGREVMHFWESLYDAEPVRMSVEEHDRRLAWMDQLPHLLAALQGVATARGPLRAATIGGQAARLGSLLPAGALKAPDLSANRALLLEALSDTASALDELRRVLAAGDDAALAAWLASAAAGEVR